MLRTLVLLWTAMWVAPLPAAGQPAGAVNSVADVAAAVTSEGDACREDLRDLSAYLIRNDAGLVSALASGVSNLHAWPEPFRAPAARALTRADCQGVLLAALAEVRHSHLYLRASDAPQLAALAGSADSAPRLEALSRSTVLLRIPGFGEGMRDLIASLIESNARTLRLHPYWIIDVRGNGGGTDSSWQPLLGAFVNGRVGFFALEFYATPENAVASERLKDMVTDRQGSRSHFESEARLLRLAPAGQFVKPEGAPMMRLQHVRVSGRFAPRRVAILIDRGCVSSCEEFLLAARQDLRVKLFGTRTEGALDYSNLRPWTVPSGRWTVWYAVSRSLRLPDFPVDQTGITPDVPWRSAAEPEDQSELVQDVRHLLEEIGSNGPVTGGRTPQRTKANRK